MIPNIWGQSEGYTYIQLRDFKSGARNAPEDAAMRGFVATMSDADMLEMAKYPSTQPWPKVEPISTDAALLKKGRYRRSRGISQRSTIVIRANRRARSQISGTSASSHAFEGSFADIGTIY